MTDKPRSDYNSAMLDTLFLDGGNANYLEQMQARYASNPNSVDPSWQRYFASLGEEAAIAKKNAEGPSWKRDNWPAEPNGELTAALTGDWGADDPVETKVAGRMAGASDEDVRQATKDSLRALMLIRAYRCAGI